LYPFSQRTGGHTRKHPVAHNLHPLKKTFFMPWYNGDYPPSYKNQPEKLREKAVEIANALLEGGTPEGIAIATGLKQAREYFSNKEKEGTEKKQLTKRKKKRTVVNRSK